MTAAAFAVLAGVAGAHAQSQTEVTIQYPYPELFTETHKKIAEEFAKVRPDIKVTMRAPYESYEDGTQRVLREAVTNQMPDVSFQGLNRIRVLVDKNIPAPLDGYIAAEKDFDKQGFHQAMFDIGTSSGKVYALPFAISLPIVYVNLDLAKKAGADPEKAAPAHRADLSGMPPAWIGVGSRDLFHDECRAYSERLRQAGVAVHEEIAEGAFHAFDLIAPNASVSQRFFASQCRAIRSALVETG